MSLPHALLGLISYSPATGYDLKTRFNESIHFFWNATLPQIYRTLSQMEENGWVGSVVEHQEGRPSKRIYGITAQGRDELFRWLAAPLEMVAPRLPMLVKVFFGNQLPREKFIAQVVAWRSAHVDMLKQFERGVMPVIDRYSGMEGLGPEAPFWAMTLDFGIRQVRMTIEWCDKVLDQMKGGRESESDPSGQGER